MFTLLLIFVTLTLIYLAIRYNYGYWKRRGIPSIEPTFPFGTFRFGHPVLHFSQQLSDQYLKFKKISPVFGGFRTLEPVLIVADPNLAKQLLIKEFNIFHDRGLYHNPRDDPILDHLFVMEGKRWKKMREKLTPTFTSGKMKLMYKIIEKIGEELVDTLRNEVKVTNPIEIKDVLARFTTDVIGNCAFGLETNSLKDPKSDFRVFGGQFFTKFNPAKVFFASAFPNLARNLHLRISDVELSNFIINTVKQTIEYREKNNVERHDFMDLMIKLKNEGSNDVERITLSEIVANCVLFFIAGFDTSANTAAFALHELSKNLELQSRARDHINTVLKKHGGELTYEALQEMTFLEQILNETLRLYPVAPFLVRKSNENYKIPDTDIIIEKGTTVFVPTYGYQHDPDYFEDPETFDPTRFDPGKSLNREAHLPFGDGPRACIGERFARVQAKVAIALILKNFVFKIDPEKRNEKVRFKTNTILLMTRDGFFLNMQPIHG